MARQGHNTTNRRPHRRLRASNSKIMALQRDGRGKVTGHKVIYQGNDTIANRLWATVVDISGVLAMARER